MIKVLWQVTVIVGNVSQYTYKMIARMSADESLIWELCSKIRSIKPVNHDA